MRVRLSIHHGMTPETNSADIVILDFQPLEHLSVLAIQSMLVCYGNQS